MGRTLDDGVSLTYRPDRSLFHLHCLQARTKTLSDKVLKLQYSDDCVLIAHSPEDLQEALNIMYEIYYTLGLVIKLINTNNTEIMYQWSCAAPPVEPVISVAKAELQISPQFNYLGSVLSVDCSIDELNRRINRALATFDRIRDRVIQNHNIRLAMKIAVYQAICLSMLLYGSETFTLYRKHIKLL
ncbi:hypothetical protein Pmani_001436 [Petrolisthes manimaculis]|uniref:Reverse transcriptase domain-containing protein n=1 Tax=Petrolisthes manimaculis TaxID=1843537 RepID=A0AAE1URZ9_9EUCA|nr:hypothetical protein Pmani_001436 [Petrolisthes manimaculis]